MITQLSQLLAEFDQKAEARSDRVLYLLLKRFEDELPELDERFHKTFRQCDCVDDGHHGLMDMAIWHLLFESKAFWRVFEKYRTDKPNTEQQLQLQTQPQRRFCRGDRVRVSKEGERVVLGIGTSIPSRHRNGVLQSRTGTVAADCRQDDVVCVIPDSAPDTKQYWGASFWELDNTPPELTEPQQ